MTTTTSYRPNLPDAIRHYLNPLKLAGVLRRRHIPRRYCYMVAGVYQIIYRSIGL